MTLKNFPTQKNIWETAGIIIWTIAVGAYFLQFPFSILSNIMTPALFLYVLLQIPKCRILKDKKYIFLISIYFLFLAFLVLRSVLLDISITRIIRFLVILAAIPTIFCLNDENFTVKKDIFMSLAVIKAIILIFFAAVLIHFGDYSFFRQWAKEFALGDIYFLNRLAPKIQVHGNALLVVAFMLDFEEHGKFTIKNIILLLGVLCAGNFAFLLALCVFIGWKFIRFALEYSKKHKWAKWAFIGICLLAVICATPFVYAKILEKAPVSNAVRLDQANILLNTHFWIGNGLGSWIEAQTPILAYSGDIYFEMQTLYVFNQIGVIGLSLFYAVTLIPMYAMGKNRFILYLIYLLFSFWNPYCFDVTQLFTVILITNMSELGDYHAKSTYYRLSSLRKRTQ